MYKKYQLVAKRMKTDNDINVHDKVDPRKDAKQHVLDISRILWTVVLPTLGYPDVNAMEYTGIDSILCDIAEAFFPLTRVICGFMYNHKPSLMANIGRDGKLRCLNTTYSMVSYQRNVVQIFSPYLMDIMKYGRLECVPWVMARFYIKNKSMPHILYDIFLYRRFDVLVELESVYRCFRIPLCLSMADKLLSGLFKCGIPMASTALKMLFWMVGHMAHHMIYLYPMSPNSLLNEFPQILSKYTRQEICSTLIDYKGLDARVYDDLYVACSLYKSHIGASFSLSLVAENLNKEWRAALSWRVIKKIVENMINNKNDAAFNTWCIVNTLLDVRHSKMGYDRPALRMLLRELTKNIPELTNHWVACTISSIIKCPGMQVPSNMGYDNVCPVLYRLIADGDILYGQSYFVKHEQRTRITHGDA